MTEERLAMAKITTVIPVGISGQRGQIPFLILSKRGLTPLINLLQIML